MYFKQFSPLFALKLITLAMCKRILNPKGIVFYSQLGEDQFILSLLCDYCGYAENNFKGFYLDIGCNDPIKFSNTFGLYCNGWRGICVDANLGLINKFKKTRKLDHAVHAAVSDQEEVVDFYFSDLDLVSTMHVPFTEGEWKEQNYKLKEVKKMKTVTLNTILKDFEQDDRSHFLNKIDLLSIDVEGHDFNVLKSIDLNKYRPSIIVIEMHEFDKSNPTKDEIYQYLYSHNYDMVGHHIINGFFIAKELKN